MASYNDFEKIDIRVGRVIEVKPFPEAKKPAFKLTVDFGDNIGLKNTSAQLSDNYSPETLLNKSVLGVVNIGSKQIGTYTSEVLILGVPDHENNTVLIVPEKNVPPGGKLY
jgi:tRNA-binding protein